MLLISIAKQKTLAKPFCHSVYMNIYTEELYSPFETSSDFRVECFCGMEEPLQTKRLPDSSCNMKCSGNPKQTCGGYLTINIYWTGIQSK